VRLVGATALASLAIAGGATTAVADLAPQGCIQDNDSAAPDACEQTTDGLGAAHDVVVSPDGRSVYAASLLDDAIVRFARDPVTGALTPQGCVDDDDTGLDDCAQQTPGLSATKSLAVSPDGTSLYAVSEADHAIVHFARDPGTGAIAPVGCIEDDDTGNGECATAADGLGGPYTVAISAEGNSVYVASHGDDAIARFDRDTGTGELGFASCIEDDDTASGECGGTADGLSAAISVAVSPDGHSVYALSEIDDALVRFDRVAATGSISPQGCVDDNDFAADASQGEDDCARSTDGMHRPRSLAISPDGLSVYVGTREGDDAVVRFDRAADGTLTPAGCVDDNDTGVDDCAQSTDGLDDVWSLAVSPDGLSVYAAGRGDDSVVRFDRSPNPGELTPRGCVEDNDPPQGGDDCAAADDGLDGARTVAFSPDGGSMYVVSEFDESVVTFAPDADPPETQIVKGPRKKTRKRKARFEFASDETGSSFICKLDRKDFAPCDASERFKVNRRRHKLLVAAVDPAGNTDPTPAKRKWKVRKKS
jgi:6-phosphogluconolactonase (cycloisomerase 2 family)